MVFQVTPRFSQCRFEILALCASASTKALFWPCSASAAIKAARQVEKVRLAASRDASILLALVCPDSKSAWCQRIGCLNDFLRMPAWYFVNGSHLQVTIAHEEYSSHAVPAWRHLRPSSVLQPNNGNTFLDWRKSSPAKLRKYRFLWTAFFRKIPFLLGVKFEFVSIMDARRVRVKISNLGSTLENGFI